jgi:hypothetical protein
MNSDVIARCWRGVPELGRKRAPIRLEPKPGLTLVEAGDCDELAGIKSG